MDNSKRNDRISGEQEPASLLMDDVQGKSLLHLARSTIEHYLLYETVRDYKCDDPLTPRSNGLFVTLWGKDTTQTGKAHSESTILRGCIGHLESDLPLYDYVQKVAIGAATRDPRFPPLAIAELDTVRIEISILSPLRKINKLQEINIGQDGIILEGLGKRGLLLPNVAVRMGWDSESFLRGVCNKAGLPFCCWPGDCDLFAFTAVVFDEAELGVQKD